MSEEPPEGNDTRITAQTILSTMPPTFWEMFTYYVGPRARERESERESESESESELKFKAYLTSDLRHCMRKN